MEGLFYSHFFVNATNSLVLKGALLRIWWSEVASYNAFFGDNSRMCMLLVYLMG